MKTKIVVFLSLISLAFVFINHEYSFAQSSRSSSKIGIVSIKRVSEDCKATANYLTKAELERADLAKQEKNLASEIETLKVELDSGALSFGSTDFYARSRELAKKEAELDYLKSFNSQEQALKGQLWKMELYKKILEITNKVGDEKGMDLILAVNEPEITEQRIEELGTVVMTHKVLYSGGCVDLTKEVIDKLDQAMNAGN